MSSVTVHGVSQGAGKADFGDVRAEFQALISRAGVYEIGPRAKIALTGDDRVRWLNGMISNNVRDLAAGHGVYAFVLNAQGKIQGDLYAFQRGDSLLVDSDAAQQDKILQIFDHYIIADDVEVKNVSDQFHALGLIGPESRTVLERAGIQIPELGRLQFADVKWREIAVTVFRPGEEMGDAWQIWSAPESAPTVWSALIDAGGKAVGSQAVNLYRIGRGVPAYGQDIGERDLPQETGQMRALSFTKGCYLGQEIVERIRSRGAVHRRFGIFEVEGPVPERGTKIQAEGKEVGEITSAGILPLPAGDKAIAVGYMRREGAGKGLKAGSSRLTVSATVL